MNYKRTKLLLTLSGIALFYLFVSCKPQRPKATQVLTKLSLEAIQRSHENIRNNVRNPMFPVRGTPGVLWYKHPHERPCEAYKLDRMENDPASPNVYLMFVCPGVGDYYVSVGLRRPNEKEKNYVPVVVEFGPPKTPRGVLQ